MSVKNEATSRPSDCSILRYTILAIVPVIRSKEQPFACDEDGQVHETVLVDGLSCVTRPHNGLNHQR